VTKLKPDLGEAMRPIGDLFYTVQPPGGALSVVRYGSNYRGTTTHENSDKQQLIGAGEILTADKAHSNVMS